MVKSITDAALTLNIIAGPDPLDPLTMTAENPDLERRIDYGKALEEEGWMKGKRMGLLVGEGFWVKGNVTEMAKRTLDGVVKTVSGCLFKMREYGLADVSTYIWTRSRGYSARGVGRRGRPGYWL